MANPIILTRLDDSEDGRRILDEFERRTGLRGEERPDGRYYELAGDEHRTPLVQTLTEIDRRWTEHIGFKDPA